MKIRCVCVAIITVLAIVNKLSGFFGLFANGEFSKIIINLYSVLAVFAFAYGLYGVLMDNSKIFGRYALAYIFDLAVSAVQTIALAVTWFMTRDRLFDPQPDDQGEPQTPVSDEVRQGFQFEGGISILILLALWFLHLYFALAIWSYSYVLIHRNDLPTNMVGGHTSVGRDATPMMYLPKLGKAPAGRGNHTILRNEDDDNFV
ncbi:hypothetical protein DFQ27_008419 [Actinomortierella ambigua]|uniref:Uncharacterized protein n=1 Tax=Actinomortierella ambigua TaxID=1343610 RepID=A0A9P6PTV3_9FUNG|nr:hypothetical protein DFQ27_008419 [Actinomortierella ambigua]